MELKIGFIGLGVMGKPMAEHIKNAGHELYVYTRTKEKCLKKKKKGVIWCNDVAECARCSDVMVTMIGFPKDVEEVYFGKDGVIENMKEGVDRFGCIHPLLNVIHDEHIDRLIVVDQIIRRIMTN